MKISLVTVCFNSMETIGQALQSVASQTWPYVEHIVVDGASTDQTMAVVRRYESKLAHVVSERDRGVYDAMNKGIALATGDAIAFLNADDYYAHNQVLERVATVMTDENLDVLYGDVEYFNPGKSSTVVRRYNSSKFQPARIGWGWMPAHPALFVRRKLFERYGVFDPDYRIAGDFEFIARIFQDHDLRHRYLPETLVRMQTGGISTSGLRSTMLLNREMMRACRANAIQTNWFKILLRYPSKLSEFWNV